MQAFLAIVIFRVELLLYLETVQCQSPDGHFATPRGYVPKNFYQRKFQFKSLQLSTSKTSILSKISHQVKRNHGNPHTQLLMNSFRKPHSKEVIVCWWRQMLRAEPQTSVKSVWKRCQMVDLMRLVFINIDLKLRGIMYSNINVNTCYIMLCNNMYYYTSYAMVNNSRTPLICDYICYISCDLPLFSRILLWRKTGENLASSTNGP